MEKKNAIINSAFIVIFALMLSLPILFINHEENKASKIENKMLAQRPELYLEDGSLNKLYIAEFEDYFNDNIGFKEEALIVNILLKDKIFGILDIPNWLVGEEGNLFYTSGGEDIATFAGANYFSEEAMQNMTDNLNYLNQYFKQQGCQTYNMFIPNKEAIYSELYDPNVYHAENSRMDILSQYIADHTDLNVINVKDALLANKSEQLYYKSCDASHWNMNGAFVGYQELMYAIQKHDPDIKILKKEDFDITENNYKGLMSYYTDVPILHNNFAYEDVIYSYHLRGEYHSTEETGLDGMVLNPNLNYHHYNNENASTRKKLLIVGDSYIYEFILPMLAESFEDVYFIRNADVETVIQLAEKAKPDIFVFEVVERACSEGYFSIMSGYSNYLNIPSDISCSQ